MEQVAVGILMIVSFIVGAWVRKPFAIPIKENNKPSRHKEEDTQVDEDERIALEEEQKLQKQLEAMYAYTEKQALDKDVK